MTMTGFVRCWNFATRPTRCMACRKPAIRWVTTDQGRKLPFDVSAKPVRYDHDPVREVDFAVYDTRTAFHSQHCAAKKPKRVDNP